MIQSIPKHPRSTPTAADDRGDAGDVLQCGGSACASYSNPDDWSPNNNSGGQIPIAGSGIPGNFVAALPLSRLLCIYRLVWSLLFGFPLLHDFQPLHFILRIKKAAIHFAAVWLHTKLSFQKPITVMLTLKFWGDLTSPASPPGLPRADTFTAP